MKLFTFLFGWIKFKKTPKNLEERNHPRNVKPGDSIVIEWDRIKGHIGHLCCVNNDTETQKILLEVKWNNYKDIPGTPKSEKIIVDYNSSYLKNFNLLNPIKKNKVEKEEIDDYDIISLQSELNKALESQEYEKANEIQIKIDKLVKK